MLLSSELHEFSMALAGGIHRGLQGIVVRHVGAGVSVPGGVPIAMRGRRGSAGCRTAPTIITASAQNPTIATRAMMTAYSTSPCPRFRLEGENNDIMVKLLCLIIIHCAQVGACKGYRVICSILQSQDFRFYCSKTICLH